MVRAYLEAKRVKWSGCNEEDVITAAHIMWKEATGGRFVLNLASNILRQYDKWASANSKRHDRVKKVKSKRQTPIYNSP